MHITGLYYPKHVLIEEATGQSISCILHRADKKPATASTVAGSVSRLKLPVIPDISQVSSAADVLLSQY